MDSLCFGLITVVLITPILLAHSTRLLTISFLRKSAGMTGNRLKIEISLAVGIWVERIALGLTGFEHVLIDF